jgi:predicted AlkP superfamily pyrophosphatase or phosphodiesterase
MAHARRLSGAGRAVPGRRSGRGAVATLAAAALLASCGGDSPTAPSNPPVAPSPRKLVIVSIDGLRGDAAATAPTLAGLAARGASTWRAQTVMPSITLSAHASMLSGDRPDVHGMTWPEWDPRGAMIPVPTILAIAREAGLRTAMVVGKPKLAHLNPSGSTDVFVVCGNDDDVVTRALVEINLGTDLLFVHLPDTDLAGHRQGWMSPAYLAALAGADQALGRLVAAAPPSTTFLVTADHGGHGKDHSAGEPQDTTIPWIIAGPGIRQGLVLSQLVRVYDTAPTAAAVLGLPVPLSMEGRPVAEALFAAAPPMRAAQ